MSRDIERGDGSLFTVEWLSPVQPFELTTRDATYGDEVLVTLELKRAALMQRISAEVAATEPDLLRLVVDDSVERMKTAMISMHGLDGQARNVLSRKLYHAALNDPSIMDYSERMAILNFLRKYVPENG